MDDEPAVETKTWSLAAEEELRIELGDKTTVTLAMKRGTAEVFGCELAEGQRLTISAAQFAVFTFSGCQLDVEGVPDSAYKASETPMVSYLNTHGVLEERRVAAQAAGSAGEGPRVLLAGPTDSGKSTLARVLVNYAARRQWAPLLIDLDVGQNGIGPPGTIAAVPVDAPVDPVEGVPLEVPLVYWFGHTTPDDNPDYYRFLVERMAGLVDQRAQASVGARAAGMVVNTMGWIEGQGYKLLLHAATTLKIDVILVLGHERLHSELSAEFASNPAVSVVKLQRSGGVVTRTPEYRKASRERRVREYLYGAQGELSPSSQTVPFSDLQIFRVGGGARVPTSAMPVGVESATDPMQLKAVAPSMELMGALLGVSHATEQSEILSSNVAGFVLVTEVDVKKQTVTYVAPSPGALPGPYLVLGTVSCFTQ